MGKRWFKHSKWPRILVWIHSYTIISFVLLMCSGIALVNPSVHTGLIPVLPVIYQIHILLGLVFAVTLLTPFVRLIPKGKAIRRLDWLLPMSLGTIIVITGVMIWLVTVFPTAWRSAGSIWHGRISYLLGVWIIIHAFYRLGDIVHLAKALTPRYNQSDVCSLSGLAEELLEQPCCRS